MSASAPASTPGPVGPTCCKLCGFVYVGTVAHPECDRCHTVKRAVERVLLFRQCTLFVEWVIGVAQTAARGAVHEHCAECAARRIVK